LLAIWITVKFQTSTVPLSSSSSSSVSYSTIAAWAEIPLWRQSIEPAKLPPPRRSSSRHRARRHGRAQPSSPPPALFAKNISCSRIQPRHSPHSLHAAPHWTEPPLPCVPDHVRRRPRTAARKWEAWGGEGRTDKRKNIENTMTCGTHFAGPQRVRWAGPVPRVRLPNGENLTDYGRNGVNGVEEKKIRWMAYGFQASL
jgi:hypothetical protein